MNKNLLEKSLLEEKHYHGHRKRLKDKVIKSQSRTLMDYEILEVLLFIAKTRADVKPLAKNLIKKCGSFAKIFNADMEFLKTIEGVNDSVLAVLKCVKESMNIILNEEIKEKPVINNWKKLIEYLRIHLAHNIIEKYMILFLNKKYMLIKDELNEFGTVDQVHIYVREVIKKAFHYGASFLILAHNHPSEECLPSESDLNITAKLQRACDNVNIKLIDHVIITSAKHYSFASSGLL